MVLAVVAIVVIEALSNGNTSSSSDIGGSDSSAIDERTCEIFRDISAAAADHIDSLDETRDRLKDLYEGYGQSTSPAIQSSLRALVGSMTVGDYGAAADDIPAVGAACSTEGF